ncbi:hypothetical protein [Ruminococcus flavefaciens]|uniref:Uncharacterized protein n=1 Tax=Ruminococcus flavefaciens TaxID=1265 RepID=A0A1M7JQZ4_RUMFL|nr:hypothetical protein [Ruminococcus flavefaciens]SHM55341.1 hypothetical protein SAMN04487860_106162 [Ruminococcus flavefaciens]
MTNKLKNEMEKIKMPKDTKERIIAACENTARNKVISKIDNDGYTDHVFTAERVKPKNRIMRSISAVAACAVIAGGIGTTGYLFHRNGSSPVADVESTTVFSEPDEQMSNTGCPFGDFNDFEFSIKFGDDGEELIGFSDETRSKLADFLNTFNWGDEIEEAEVKVLDENEINDEKYAMISWSKDNKKYFVAVSDSGLVGAASLESPQDLQPITDIKYYRVDFNAFYKGMKDILDMDPFAEKTTFTACEDSPFTDILAKDYNVSPFTLDFAQADQEKYDKMAELINSQKWFEFDGIDVYHAWSFDPNRNNFTIRCDEGSTVSYASFDYTDTATIYSVTYDENGVIADQDWKFYRCDDKHFGCKLGDIFGTYIPDDFRNWEPDENEAEIYEHKCNAIDFSEVLAWNDCDYTVIAGDRDERISMTPEQIEQFKKCFDNIELKKENMVPDLWAGYGSPEFEADFGNTFVMISNENVLKDISISMDKKLIAIYDGGTSCSSNMCTRVYRIDDPEQFQFVLDIIK